jgi:hypothetical protein
MENNFENLLDKLISTKKGKFLNLLRRNGVVVSPDIGLVELKGVMGNAMAKSKTFRDETYLLVTTLVTSDLDDNFANTSGMFQPKDFGTDIFGTTTTGGSTTSTTSTATSTAKPFGETTFGKVTDTISTWGNLWLKSLEIQKDKKQAEAQIAVATVGGSQLNIPKAQPKSKTGLYVGLGLAGVAVVGVIIYFATKK